MFTMTSSDSDLLAYNIPLEELVMLRKKIVYNKSILIESLLRFCDGIHITSERWDDTDKHHKILRSFTNLCLHTVVCVREVPFTNDRIETVVYKAINDNGDNFTKLLTAGTTCVAERLGKWKCVALLDYSALVFLRMETCQKIRIDFVLKTS